MRYDFTNFTAQFGTFRAIRLQRMSECCIQLNAFEKSTGTANTAASLSLSILLRMKWTILGGPYSALSSIPAFLPSDLGPGAVGYTAISSLRLAVIVVAYPGSQTYPS